MTALYRITMSILIVLIIISIVTCALSVVAAQTPRTLVNDANVKITKSGHRIIIDAHNSQYVLVAHRVKKKRTANSTNAYSDHRYNRLHSSTWRAASYQRQQRIYNFNT